MPGSLKTWVTSVFVAFACRKGCVFVFSLSLQWSWSSCGWLHLQHSSQPCDWSNQGFSLHSYYCKPLECINHISTDLNKHLVSFQPKWLFRRDCFVLFSQDAPVTGRKADVIRAAYLCAEAALRLVKPGNQVSGLMPYIRERQLLDHWWCGLTQALKNTIQNLLKREKLSVVLPL